MTDHSAIKKQRRYTFDSLEREYSYRRVSGLAYATAGIYRSILEQAADRSVSRPPREYQTRLLLKDAAMLGVMTNRALAIEHRKFVRSQLGADARRILELLLLGKASFVTIAAARGYAGDTALRLFHLGQHLTGPARRSRLTPVRGEGLLYQVGAHLLSAGPQRVRSSQRQFWQLA